ncbi:MAG: GrdX protein [Clostridiales bacterium]|jgi:hypothetical protein|nr:GrdX protein [Clostridiales bacterium]
MLILTNNPLVNTKASIERQHLLAYHPVTYLQVLLLARDFVHQGHRLLTHPLSGSVKPNETLYKSIGISESPRDGLCFDSLRLIEDAIAAFKRFAPRDREITPQMDSDFQLVDWTLLQSAFSSALTHPL